MEKINFKNLTREFNKNIIFLDKTTINNIDSIDLNSLYIINFIDLELTDEKVSSFILKLNSFYVLQYENFIYKMSNNVRTEWINKVKLVSNTVVGETFNEQYLRLYYFYENQR
jgi:hypothetical protein